MERDELRAHLWVDCVAVFTLGTVLFVFAGLPAAGALVSKVCTESVAATTLAFADVLSEACLAGGS